MQVFALIEGDNSKTINPTIFQKKRTNLRTESKEGMTEGKHRKTTLNPSTKATEEDCPFSNSEGIHSSRIILKEDALLLAKE